jgi:acetylglutamate kinase
MPKKNRNILIKVSGDATDSPKFFKFATNKARNNYVVVICGAGSKINDELLEAGYAIRFGKHGRETRSWKERKLVRDVLEREEKRLQNKFVGTGVNVIAPILYAGSVLCHINGDNLVKTYYLGFDEIYVFTLKERIAKKRNLFGDFPKVKVVGI